MSNLFEETWGRLGHLTPEQIKTLETFKVELKEYYKPEEHDDATLLRFLRARKFQLEQAIKMFVDCEKWKIEYKVDTVK